MAKKETKKVRPLSEIAREIHSDWGKKTYFGAKPYITAMLSLNSIDDKYMFDDARDIFAISLQTQALGGAKLQRGLRQN